MIYYQLKIPSFAQYKYAWAELPEDATISDEFPECPKCGRAIGQHFWLQPHNVIIKQPKKVGDFVGGLVGADLIVSERFRDIYEQSELTGLDDFFQLNVVQMGSKKGKEYPKPELFGATVRISNARVNYDLMNVKWFDSPKEDICNLCCPGGGGDGGIYESYDSIHLIPETVEHYDFFIPINFVGNITISERAKEFIETNKFTNVLIEPNTHSKHNIFTVD